MLPIGGGLWIVVLHPEQRIAPPYTEWTFAGDTVRMPEFTAPALGNKPNLVTIDADIPASANGVLYKLGANSGGLTCFVEDGILCYEYNLFIIQRTKIRAEREASRRQGDDRGRDDLRRTQARRPAEDHDASEWRSRRRGRRSDQRAAAVHRQRLPRHRHRARIAGVARLLRVRRRIP